MLLSRVAGKLRTRGRRGRVIFLLLFGLRLCGRRRHAHSRNWHTTASTSIGLAGVVERWWLRSAGLRSVGNLTSGTHRWRIVEAVTDVANAAAWSVLIVWLLLLRHLGLVLAGLLLADTTAAGLRGNLNTPFLSSVATLPAASALLALNWARGSTRTGRNR